MDGRSARNRVDARVKIAAHGFARTRTDAREAGSRAR
jgi:hypothetical protein